MKALTYYQRNRVKVLRKTRQTRLTSRGGKVYQHLKKSPWPEACELCERYGGSKVKYRRLEYHHWSDKHPSIGLWLCPRCHRAAEVIDSTWFEVYLHPYLSLKARIIKPYDESTS